MARKALCCLFSVLLISSFCGASKAVQIETFHVQSHKTMLTVTNPSLNVSLVADTAQGDFILLDGKSCGIYISKSGGTGASIKSGLWDAKRQQLIDFVQGVALLSSLTDKGEKFELKSVPKDALEASLKVVSGLVSYAKEELETEPFVALNLVSSVVEQISSYIKGGPLDGILEELTDKTELKCGITHLLNVLQGLKMIVPKLATDVQSLAVKGVKLKLEEITGAENGVKALAALISQIGSNADLNSISEILGHEETLFELIALLGGKSTLGLTGAFQVLSEIVKQSKGQSSLNWVFGCFVQFLSVSTQEDFNGWITDVSSLEKAVKAAKATKKLVKFVTIVNKLSQDKLVFEKLNLSKILKIVTSTSDKPLEALTELVKVLEVSVDKESSGLAIVQVFIAKISSASGLKQIQKFVQIEGTVQSISTSLAKSLPKVVVALKTDAWSALKELPTIGNILKTLDTAFLKEKIDIKQAINKSLDLILGILQVVSGFELGLSKTVFAQAKIMVTSLVSVDTYLNVKITAVC